MGNTQNTNEKDLKEITFVEDYVPSLKAGMYKVSLRQELMDGRNTPTSPIEKLLFKKIPDGISFSKEKDFFVSGERFNLRPLDIDSVFPPDMSVGKFYDTLPHLVFNDPSLPWQRSLFAGKKGDPKTPWLALLLFDENDPAPNPRRVPVSTLLNPQERKEGFFFPDTFSLEPGESPTDMVTIIDVPVDVFNRICPSVEDLKWLAHGREVNVSYKAKDKNREQTGKYAVSLSSRLPVPEKESIVHLVALEGFGEMLSTHDPHQTVANKKENPALKGFHHVRLISYRKWRFKCESNKDNFSNLLKSLNKGASEILKGQLPQSELRLYKDIKKEGAGERIDSFLNQGFVPLPHLMRQGYQTISMYRGPLAPTEIPNFIKANIDNQDQLYFKDPQSNILDVSYACAWQLGQMLGLRNQKFTQALINWKMHNKFSAISAWEKKQLASKFEFIENNNGVFLPFKKEATEVFKVPESQPAEKFSGDALLKNENPFKRDTQKEKDPEYQITELPNLCKDYFKSLEKLHDVPFHYLVPNMEMLPNESIKFFFLDRNWVNALLAGAMNIGDFAVGADLKEEAGNIDFERFLDWKNNKKSPVHGFILRSRILTGWPGLEMYPQTAGGKLMDHVRMEKLADDIAIVMVEGKIGKLVFREPGEGVHFGFDLADENIKKVYRGNDIKGTDGNIFPDLNEKNLVNMSKLSAAFLSVNPNGYSNADFAYQMVEGVDKETFFFEQEQTA
ncbi:MAG: hypothetical protein KDC24_01355 [Saprospiraceae bacterium]|nr:hypothetical protein [Saprospiraceae bacterium]